MKKLYQLSLLLLSSILIGNTYSLKLSNKDTKYHVYSITDETLAEYINNIPFTSQKFKKAFIKYIKDNNIVFNSLDEIKILELANIDDLSDLNYFHNLEELSIIDSNITGYNNISKLKLKHLCLDNVLNINKNVLEGKELSGLYVSSTPNIDYSYVNKDLDALTIYNTYVDDYSFFSSMRNLKYIELGKTNFEDFSLILNNVLLNTLYLDRVYIKNIDGIKNLKVLHNLTLDTCLELESYDEVNDLEKLNTFTIRNMEMIYQEPSSKITNKSYINDDKEIKDAIIELNNQLNLDNYTNDYDKIKAINDLVCDKIDYIYPLTENDSLYCNLEALKSAINGNGVCISYACLLKSLLDLNNFDNYLVISTYKGHEDTYEDQVYSHAYNIVKVNIDNKDNWYYIDSTDYDNNISDDKALLIALDNVEFNNYKRPSYLPNEIVNEYQDYDFPWTKDYISPYRIDIDRITYLESIPFKSKKFKDAIIRYFEDNFVEFSCLEDIEMLILTDVDDLSDLKYFPNLKSLDISNSNLKTNNTINNTKLNRLRLDSVTNIDKDILKDKLINDLTINNTYNIDYSYINKDIEYLTISNNTLDDYSFISNLSNLKYLDLSNTNFDDFSLILNNKDLSILNLSKTDINNIDDIELLSELRYFMYDDCPKLSKKEIKERILSK